MGPRWRLREHAARALARVVASGNTERRTALIPTRRAVNGGCGEPNASEARWWSRMPRMVDVRRDALFPPPLRLDHRRMRVRSRERQVGDGGSTARDDGDPPGRRRNPYRDA